MANVERSILAIQTRGKNNPSQLLEQQLLQPLADMAGVTLTFVDSLEDDFHWDPERVLREFSGILTLGSDAVVTSEPDHPATSISFNHMLPVLERTSQTDLLEEDICYGTQTRMIAVSGDLTIVQARPERAEGGTIALTLEPGIEHPVLSSIPTEDNGQRTIRMIYAHNDAVTGVLKGYRVIGHTDKDPYSAFMREDGRKVSFIGHPELNVEETVRRMEAINRQRGELQLQAYKVPDTFTDPDPTAPTLIVNFFKEVKKEESCFTSYPTINQ